MRIDLRRHLTRHYKGLRLLYSNSNLPIIYNSISSLINKSNDPVGGPRNFSRPQSSAFLLRGVEVCTFIHD